MRFGFLIMILTLVLTSTVRAQQGCVNGSCQVQRGFSGTQVPPQYPMGYVNPSSQNSSPQYPMGYSYPSHHQYSYTRDFYPCNSYQVYHFRPRLRGLGHFRRLFCCR